jgi:FKBP-type peptidyl-prolyl cis-trans isomerase
MDLGRDFKRNAIDVDPQLLLKGMNDSLAGKTLLTEEQAREVMMAFQQELRAKQMEMRKAEGEKNKKAGETFLAENKKKEGVKTLEVKLPDGRTSELQYKIITEGKGKVPTSNDTVVTHYRGTLTDGTEFDSSYKKGEPTKFPVTGVIKGWTEALLRMPVGSKWQLFIPATLAYGEMARPNIPANSTLLFDIELMGIEDAAKKDAPKPQ